MLDKLGTEIKPGDTIAYTVGTKGLSIGKVISLDEVYDGWHQYHIKVHGTWGSHENPHLKSKPGVLNYPDTVIVLTFVPESYKRELDYVAIQ